MKLYLFRSTRGGTHFRSLSSEKAAIALGKRLYSLGRRLPLEPSPAGRFLAVAAGYPDGRAPFHVRVYAVDVPTDGEHDLPLVWGSA